jgi:DNA (cytosine-5)-methyltransferase 1
VSAEKIGSGVMLKLATVFSGIGAIEHALERMKIEHEIIFACDNGGIDPWDKMTEEEIKKTKEDIHNTEDYRIKKDKVDNLYLERKRKNFVEQSYLENYRIEKDKFYQDVSFLDGRAYTGQVDLFVGGSPCQSFSIAGKRGGLEDTRGTLFYEFARLVKEIQPRVFIYENVKGLLNHDKGKTWDVMKNVFDDLGYKWNMQVLNAKDFGIPQSRPRVFVVGFKENVNFSFPEPKKLETKMQDYLLDSTPDKYYLSEAASNFVLREDKLKKRYTQVNGGVSLCQQAQQQFNLHGDFIYEPDIPQKYFLSDKLIKYVLSPGTKGFKVEPTINTEMAKTLLATMTKMHRASIDNYVTTQGKLRKLTPRECLRLMGFCDSFKICVSDTQQYRQAGNSIVVDVLISIMEEVLKVMPDFKNT